MDHNHTIDTMCNNVCDDNMLPIPLNKVMSNSSHTCLICLMSHHDPCNNECIVLNTSCPTCKYYTHDSCFAEWFSKRNKCVWCRKRIEEGYDTPPDDDDDNNHEVTHTNDDDDFSPFGVVIMNPFRGPNFIRDNHTIFSRRMPNSSGQQHVPHNIHFFHRQNILYYHFNACILFTQLLGACVILYSGYIVLHLWDYTFGRHL
jgi:hypothetical protein